MTVTNGYTTLQAIKDHKDIASVDAADDAIIEDLIEAASRYIDGVCGRRFYSTALDETRTFTAYSGAQVMTDDIVSVTTLKTDEDGDRTYEITWALTDYDLLPENAALDGHPYTYLNIAPLGQHTFPLQRKGVQIVGKFGYCATGSHPTDIELACRLITLNTYQNRYGQSNQGAATITGAGVVITPSDIPSTAIALIKPYMRFS